MELRFESGISPFPSHVFRRNSEETGFTQVLIYREGERLPILVQDTMNGYKEMAVSAPFQESLSTPKKFSSPAVDATVPTLSGEFAYIFPSIYLRSLEFLNRGGILTGILTAILGLSTTMGYLSSAVGICATAALVAIFSAFIIERLRLSRK